MVRLMPRAIWGFLSNMGVWECVNNDTRRVEVKEETLLQRHLSCPPQFLGMLKPDMGQTLCGGPPRRLSLPGRDLCLVPPPSALWTGVQGHGEGQQRVICISSPESVSHFINVFELWKFNFTSWICF